MLATFKCLLLAIGSSSWATGPYYRINKDYYNKIAVELLYQLFQQVTA